MKYIVLIMINTTTTSECNKQKLLEVFLYHLILTITWNIVNVDICILKMRKKEVQSLIDMPQITAQKVAELKFHVTLTPKAYSFSNLLYSFGKNTTYFRS